MYSIGQYIEEYLVNFTYFKEKLLEYNIDILDTEDMDKMMLPKIGNNKSSIGGFGDVFNNLGQFAQNADINTTVNLNEKFYNDIITNLSDSEKEISFFSKYFIFKKRSGQSLELKIKQHLLKNKSKRGYKTYFNKKNWTKLRKKVFDELELIGNNKLQIDSYNRATESISRDMEKSREAVKKSSQVDTQPVVISSNQPEQTKISSEKTSNKKVKKLKIKKPNKSTKNKYDAHRRKMQSVLTIIRKSIKDDMTTPQKTEIKAKIDKILSIFSVINDSEISKGVKELEAIKAQL